MEQDKEGEEANGEQAEEEVDEKMIIVSWLPFAAQCALVQSGHPRPDFLWLGCEISR